MKKESKKCTNCLSDRFHMPARGLCTRCYSLIKKLETTKQWDLENPKTLKYYPKDLIFHNQGDFTKIKNGFIKQFKDRLSYLKIKEQILNSSIKGSNIVPVFQRIARLAGSRDRDFLWHAEDLFDHNFTPKQKKILYKILNDISESIRWKGIDWYEVFRN